MNIEVETTRDNKTALINWDNVTSVTEPENYLMGQVGDTGPHLQINFTDRGFLYTKETMEDIKNKLN